MLGAIGSILTSLFMFRGTLNMSVKARQDQMERLRRNVRTMASKMRAKRGTVVKVDES